MYISLDSLLQRTIDNLIYETLFMQCHGYWALSLSHATGGWTIIVHQRDHVEDEVLGTGFWGYDIDQLEKALEKFREKTGGKPFTQKEIQGIREELWCFINASSLTHH